MCKKLAEGIDALVLDVKVGAGAFMKTLPEARELARGMVQVGKLSGKSVSALITDMNQPLGRFVGNALEVIESVEVLKGKMVPDLLEVTYALGSEMLLLSGRARNQAEGAAMLQSLISSGRAYDRFCEMVTLQGGDVSCLDQLSKLPRAPIVQDFAATQTGYVREVNPDLIGRAAIMLGAGRALTTDTIDPAVGFSDLVKVGERVEKGAPLLKIHANSAGRADQALELIREAITIGQEKPELSPVIVERV
jgi:pyrimidine-nucleoside phosphorylase